MEIIETIEHWEIIETIEHRYNRDYRTERLQRHGDYRGYRTQIL